MAKKNVKFYFAHPEVWEAGNTGRFSKEARFLDSVFKRFGKVKSVLDVGCGTGSHLAKLATLGYVGEGVDLSKEMIEFAKAKYPGLTFAVRDMKKLPYRSRFDAIVCLCTTFCYNIRNADVVASLRGMHRALKKGGIVVIECFNPIAFIQRIPFRTVVEENKRFAAVGLTSVNEHSVDERRQVLIEKRTMRRLKSGKALQSDRTELRLFFPQEMHYFLDTCGFELLDCYGDYRQYKKLDGFRFITVARKR